MAVPLIPAPAVAELREGWYDVADDPDVQLDPVMPPEGYRLEVDANGIRITAADLAGAFYARQSLEQLRTDDGVPFVTIEDHPRFAYRGLMLDVARHFFPVEVVERVIDHIAALKLNHLHLHLTDDQGWRIEIPSWPELTRSGAATQVGGRPDGETEPLSGARLYYTQDDYRRIVSHAADRFVTIVPEIDLPGHTNAASVAYPELNGARKPAAPYQGMDVGFSTLAIDSERTYQFVRDVLTELAALTPGPYLHLGGDESLSTSDQDFLTFVARATAIASGTGKTIIGWHEMGRSRELPAGTVGQYWSFVEPQGDAAARIRSFVDQGGKLILSPADVSYLDHKVLDDDPIGLVWANGTTSLRQSYEWDPAAVIPGVDERDILGIEAALWTETVSTEEQLEWMIWPRLAAIAELAWSPRSTHDWEHFRERLAEYGRVMDAAGIHFRRLPEIDWR
jgi:hexosaminidase